MFRVSVRVSVAHTTLTGGEFVALSADFGATESVAVEAPEARVKVRV